MSYRRRTALQGVFVLAVVAILPAGFFRVQTYLLLEPLMFAWSEDSANTTTSTTDSIHDEILQRDAVMLTTKNTSSSIPKARLNECLVVANRIHIHDVTKEHRSQGLPLFSSIVQSPIRNDERRRHDNGNDDDDDALYWTAHFTLVHLTWKRKHYEPRVRFPQWSYQDHGAIWYCDGQQAMVVNGGCPKGNSLHIRCPQQQNEVVTNITIYNYTYYVQDHVLCELHHAVKEPQPTAQVAAAVMAYKMDVHLALEWMEYHRLIGIDHFFVYVLDADFEMTWPDLEYITYIPWNLNPQVERSMVDLFLFQTAAQTNAILRGRALGLQWVALNDMDEYIVTRGNYTATTTSAAVAAATLPLKTLLAKYYEQSNVAAIQGETISFGKQNGSNKTRLPWLLDYTWRNDRTFGKMKRTKCIVRPTHTEYYVIHWVSWPEPDGNKQGLVIHKADPEQELWIHHYKKPQNGPFAMDLKEATTVADSFLHDMYTSVVSDRVNYMLSRVQS
jgi:Glycosyltransferase family 92